MENNLENKKKFFALYYGQDVFKVNGITYDFLELLHLDNGAVGFESIAELKSLADISDEDAIAVWSNLSNYGMNEDDKVAAVSFKGSLVEYISDEENESDWSFKDHQKVTDFLRSRGYLLPFHDLSVEQILEYGWAKISVTRTLTSQ